MEFGIQLCGWLIGVPLELLVIAALLRGAYKRFPFVFVFTIANFLTTVIEIPLTVAYYATGRSAAAERSMVYYYWRDEWILQVLVFAVVISLLYHATATLRARRMVRALLLGGAVLVAGTTFLVHYSNALIGVWMTPWTRDLNFSSAILDLALWSILIASKEKDHRLLMLSGALGIQFTGEAIGESLRHLFNTHVAEIPGNILIMLTNLVSLYIWWQTFRTAKPKGEARASN